MDREEFLKHLKRGEYNKLANLIYKDKYYLTYLDEIFNSNNKDDIRRGLLILKRLNNEIIERYLYYILRGLNDKRMIAKISEEILIKYSNKETIEEALLEISNKQLSDRIIYLFIENIGQSMFLKSILKYTKTDSVEESFKVLLKNYNSEEILKILCNKLYSQNKKEKEFALNILLNIVDSLDENQRNILRKYLNILLLGDDSKKLYNKFKQLFDKLNIEINHNKIDIMSLLKSDGKKALNLILRENIKIPSSFYNREFLREFLYGKDEDRQFIGVKLISLMNDTKNKVELLFKFLNYGYGKAKTASIKELKKIAKNDEDLRNFIETKALKYAKKMDLSLKISSLRILKEFSRRDYLPFLINEHSRLRDLILTLDEEKYMGGFRHMLMIENEIKKCKVAMDLIEEIVAEICLKYEIHYSSLRLSEKLGYEFYKTIANIGSKNLNLINIYELLRDVMYNGELIVYLTEIVSNNSNEINDELAEEILKVVENVELENKDVLNANKIIIYSSLNRIDKIGEIINMAVGYSSKLAFITAIKKLIDNNMLNDEKIKLIIPKIAEMLYDSKKLRLMALEFFEKYPNEIVIPIILNEIEKNKCNNREYKLMMNIITNAIFKYPHTINKLKNLLNTDKRNICLKIMLKVSEKMPELLRDYIYILASQYTLSDDEDKKLITKILKNITTENERKILRPIIKI
ncbi:conserved protein of unknown function [Methanocaldococcus lauensis]|uniref:Uncharacterized protein n=1 Tax=Methanocaldococcus lauensis TaxID=2546128 RepID=A0A8D6PXA1_9EURY|nr:hypothetical protein [Methanocaldococcus lauensis]CAB3289728.1 conserved protein of unknown function [Methanocaldococcus lauensis]